MPFVFDKTILFSFTALADEQPIEIDSIVGVRVYEAEPTDAELVDHANALGTAVLYETNQAKFSSEGRYEYELNLGAIDNPDRTQKGGCKPYWVCVSFRYEAADDLVAICEAIQVYYPDAIASRIGVSPHEVYELESKIKTFEGQKSDNFTFHKIRLAERMVLKMLHAEGLKRSHILEGDANDLVLYLTVVYCCRDISNEPSDIWDLKAQDYKSLFDTMFETCKVRSDPDKDGSYSESGAGSTEVYVQT